MTTTNQTTAALPVNLTVCIKHPEAMATVSTIARKIIDVGMATQLRSPEDRPEWKTADGSIINGDKETGFFDDTGNEVKPKVSELVPNVATEAETLLVLSDLPMLRPIIEGNFNIVSRATDGKDNKTAKQTDFAVFNTDGHACRMDWLRNAFRKLAGVHRENEGPKPWNEVFSGSKGKSKGRKVAVTESGSVMTFDLSAGNDSDDDKS